MGIKYRPFKPYKEGFEKAYRELMEKKKDFWDEQATKGSLSGTRDRYAKELEMQTISNYVRDGMRVLDVGCGDGETLEYLSQRFNLEVVIGYDFSAEMINKALERNYNGLPWAFDVRDIRNLKSSMTAPVDLIYTQRALINLDTWEEQRQAILDILSLLKPGGTYVMVECFQEGLDEINELRAKVGLDEIKAPWHNRYIRTSELVDFFQDTVRKEKRAYWPEQIYFSGAYYFMSRVVQAWIAKEFLETPTYDHLLNKLGTLLPPECVNLRGQTQLWAIKKKEGE